MVLNELIRASWAAGMSNVAGVLRQDFKSWISSENYRILIATTRTTFELEAFDRKILLSAIAFDAARFSSAAYESIGSVKLLEPYTQSRGWALVKLYYAAFYAAHGILRLGGCSFSRLDIDEIIHIRKVARLFGNENSPVESETFSCELSLIGNSVAASVAPGNGPHDALWRRFLIYVDALISDLQSGAYLASYTSTILPTLTALRSSLTSSGATNGSWLSKMRNDIQYQHKFNAWHPYEGTRSDRILHSAMRTFCFQEPSGLNLSPSNDIERMINTCLFIVNVMHGTLEDMSKRPVSGRSFLSYCPLAMVKSRRLTE